PPRSFSLSLHDALPISSDLFLLPSQTESFGLAALEAMASGAPVVAARTGGLSEVIDDGVDGILEPVGSVEAMARRAVTLLRDPEAHGRMRDAAIARASTFSAERVVPEYEALYQRVLARGTTRPACRWPWCWGRMRAPPRSGRSRRLVAWPRWARCTPTPPIQPAPSRRASRWERSWR